jgi:hypothetical protein
MSTENAPRKIRAIRCPVCNLLTDRSTDYGSLLIAPTEQHEPVMDPETGYTIPAEDRVCPGSCLLGGHR